MNSRDGELTESYIANKLISLGISEADTVMVSCRLPFIGRLTAGTSLEDLSRAIIEGISNRIGEKGTIIVPAYSYSFCRGSDFSPEDTPTTLGFFFETFRRRFARGRTLDPIFSVCVKGKNCDFLLNGPDDDCFGENSFYSRLHSLADCKFLLIGLDYHYITNFHFVEQTSGVSYRYIKEFPGTIVMPGGRNIHRVQKYFVRPSSLTYDFKSFLGHLQENSLGQTIPFGNVEMKTIRENTFDRTVADLLRKNESYFLGG